MIDLREDARAPSAGQDALCAPRPEANCGIAVMAKASAPARTKTRLCPPLAPAEAAAFNTAFIQDIVGNILVAGRTAAVSPYVAYGPTGAAHFFDAVLPPGVGRMEAVAANFGACLTMTLAQLFALGHPAAAVLNADSPTLPPGVLAELAEVLAAPGDRAVLGPSTDGGYYVLGLKAPHWHLFADIDWSTERVFEQTLTRAREIGLPVHVLPVWYDVDDVHALRLLHGELITGVPFGTTPLARGTARNSADLLRHLLSHDRLAERLGLPMADTETPRRRAS